MANDGEHPTDVRASDKAAMKVAFSEFLQEIPGFKAFLEHCSHSSSPARDGGTSGSGEWAREDEGESLLAGLAVTPRSESRDGGRSGKRIRVVSQELVGELE